MTGAELSLQEGVMGVSGCGAVGQSTQPPHAGIAELK
jgi:hypothetical protein